MSETSKIGIAFPVIGNQLPADHGYLLYAAISQLRPSLHKQDWFALEMISGIPFNKGLIKLPNRNAHLNMRIPADKFGEVIPLAGKTLEIENHRIRLGIPTARPLEPSANLYSKIVTFRNSTEPEQFLAKAALDLKEKLGIVAKLQFPDESHRSRHRRIITIKGKKIVGFSLIIRDLSDEDSLKILAAGLGGRKSMGCGVFNPIREMRLRGGYR